MPGKRDMSGKVRYAVVGAGWISQAAMMPGIEHTGNSEMVALVTGDAFKAKVLGEKYGIPRTYDYSEFDDLLNSGQVDAIYLALPNFAHAEFSVKALEAGVHVLLEKPMATSLEECQRIIDASGRSGAKLMVAYRLHFEPGTIGAIRMVRSGELGRLRYFSSVFSQHIAPTNHRAKNGYWAGPVPDMGTYPINQVRNLFGAEPVEVFAMGVRSAAEEFNCDDTVTVLLKFEDERMAQFVVSYNGADVDTFTVVGEKGVLESNPAYQIGVGMEHRMTIDKKTTERKFPETDHFGGEMKYFSECILTGKDPEPDGEEGLLDVRVLVAIERSLETGEVQKIEPVYRKKRPSTDQTQELGPIKPPELIHAAEPGKG